MSVYSYCGKYIYIKPSMGAGWVGWVDMLCQYIVTGANIYIKPSMGGGWVRWGVILCRCVVTVANIYILNHPWVLGGYS